MVSYNIPDVNVALSTFSYNVIERDVHVEFEVERLLCSLSYGNIQIPEELFSMCIRHERLSVDLNLAKSGDQMLNSIVHFMLSVELMQG